MKKIIISNVFLLVCVISNAQQITAPSLYSPSPGGVRILSAQGDLPSHPAIGFHSTPSNGSIANDDGAGGLGIYRPIANTLAFSTLSLERMRITSVGLFGINTDSPTDRFDINGTLRVRNLPAFASGDKLLFTDANGQIHSLSMGLSTQYLTGTGTWATLPSCNTISTCNVLNTIPKLSGINNYDCSQITDDGTNVGVNSATPAVKFEIKCGTNNSFLGSPYYGNNGLQILNTEGITGATLFLHSQAINGKKWGISSAGTGNSGGVGNLLFTNFTSGIDLMTLTPIGKLGLGTTNPTSMFTIKTPSNANFDDGISIENLSTKGAEISLKANSTNGHNYGIRSLGSGNALPGSLGIYDYTTLGYKFLIDTNGNVGIGTLSVAPGNKLEINSGINGQGGLRLTHLNSNSAVSATNSLALSVDADGDVILVPNLGNNSSTQWTRNNATSTLFPSAVTGANYTDRVAIGTNSVHSNFLNAPTGMDARLMVKGGDIIVQEDPTNNTSGPDNGADIWLLDSAGKGIDVFAQNGKAEIGTVGTNTSLYFTTDGAYHGMIMHGDAGNQGKVQIGNVTTPGNYSLYVEKGILTEKVKVALKTTTNWADYVFAPDYKLATLEEVEQFVIENKHLPNIPSANDLVKEGLDLGEMQAKQMQKIEELTLYMIAMKKEIELLKKENKVLRTNSN